MDYSKEFKDFLDIADHCGQTYVGHGNPNANILIVANEPGTVNSEIIEKDLNSNLSLWRSNINTTQSMDDLPEMFDENNYLDWPKFNPLWPYLGQHFTTSKNKASNHPTSRCWLQYQKLIDMVLDKDHECHRERTEAIDFFKQAYIIDFSAVYGLKSSDISRAAREESITKRLPLFSSDFVRHFSVIVVASGHYVRDFRQLNDLRKVFPGFNRVELIDDNLGWRNIHYSDDAHRVMIHTRHFSSSIKDEYLRSIAKICSQVITNRPL